VQIFYWSWPIFSTCSLSLCKRKLTDKKGERGEGAHLLVVGEAKLEVDVVEEAEQGWRAKQGWRFEQAEQGQWAEQERKRRWGIDGDLEARFASAAGAAGEEEEVCGQRGRKRMCGGGGGGRGGVGVAGEEEEVCGQRRRKKRCAGG
jgi:hypothetical protein